MAIINYRDENGNLVPIGIGEHTHTPGDGLSISDGKLSADVGRKAQEPMLRYLITATTLQVAPTHTLRDVIQQQAEIILRQVVEGQLRMAKTQQLQVVLTTRQKI
jgi:hypothetical protein